MIRPILKNIRQAFSGVQHRKVLYLRLRSFSAQSSSKEAERTDFKARLASIRPNPSLLTIGKETYGSGVDWKKYTISEVARRLQTFTNTDWSEYLGIIAANSKSDVLLPLSEARTVEHVRDCACIFFADNLSALKPIDYFNFLRFIRATVHCNFKRGRDRFYVYGSHHSTPIPFFAHQDISKWFTDNYESLAPQELFELLKMKTDHAILHETVTEEELTNIVKAFAHSVRVAQETAEIHNILDLLRMIELYRRVLISKEHESLFASLSSQLLALLEVSDIPANRNDLFESLEFLSDTLTVRLKKENAAISNRAVFRRYANGKYGAWKWLRHSIDIVFEDEEFDDLRPMAAVAAVRAYKWKAVDFSPDDVDRYLKIAVEPFVTNPAIYFAPSKHKFALPSELMLSKLIIAIRSAALSDLPALGKLSVRLDDAFWEKFFEMVEKEAPKLGDRARAKLHKMQFLKIAGLTVEERRFISYPFNERRRELWRDLRKRYS